MSKREAKRTPAFDSTQMAFSFDAPPRPVSEGALSGIERQVASAVAQILKDDTRTRYEVAGGLSALLDDDVSKLMLDAYASEAREGHNISAGRFIALIAESGRYDILGALLAKIGARVVVGEEVLTVELGHLEAERQRIAERITHLRRVAPAIGKQRGPRA